MHFLPEKFLGSPAGIRMLNDLGKPEKDDVNDSAHQLTADKGWRGRLLSLLCEVRSEGRTLVDDLLVILRVGVGVLEPLEMSVSVGVEEPVLFGLCRHEKRSGLEFFVG